MSVIKSRKPPSPRVFLPDLYGFHSLHQEILPPSPCTLAMSVLECSSQVEPWAFTSHLTKPPTSALRPVIPINACTFSITAAAGTELAGAYSSRYRHIVPDLLNRQQVSSLLDRSFTIRKPSSSHAASLRQTCVHCAIFPTAASRRSLGRVSSPSVAGHPLRPAIHRCHGRPLPHRLANETQTHLLARAFKKVPRFPPLPAYKVLAAVSDCCPLPMGR